MAVCEADERSLSPLARRVLASVRALQAEADARGDWLAVVTARGVWRELGVGALEALGAVWELFDAEFLSMCLLPPMAPGEMCMPRYVLREALPRHGVTPGQVLRGFLREGHERIEWEPAELR